MRYTKTLPINLVSTKSNGKREEINLLVDMGSDIARSVPALLRVAAKFYVPQALEVLFDLLDNAFCIPQYTQAMPLVESVLKNSPSAREKMLIILRALFKREYVTAMDYF